MADGEKPPMDWSLVKAYLAGVFTVTIFNRYMFLGGLIGVFTGIRRTMMVIVLFQNINFLSQEFMHNSNIQQVFQTYTKSGRILKKLLGILNLNLARKNDF